MSAPFPDSPGWDPAPEPAPSEQGWDPTDRARWTDPDSPWHRTPLDDPDTAWGRPAAPYPTPSELTHQEHR